MADSRSYRPGTAVGRPVTPRTRWAAFLPVYSGSTRLQCTSCGRPTWFGPRTRAAIDAGVARPTCIDCLVDALKAGGRLAGTVNLGNPEVHRVKREIRTMAQVAAFMNERCARCGCYLNNAPECSEACAHADGCPPDAWDFEHPNPAMRRAPRS